MFSPTGTVEPTCRHRAEDLFINTNELFFMAFGGMIYVAVIANMIRAGDCLLICCAATRDPRTIPRPAALPCLLLPHQELAAAGSFFLVRLVKFLALACLGTAALGHWHPRLFIEHRDTFYFVQ